MAYKFAAFMQGLWLIFLSSCHYMIEVTWGKSFAENLGCHFSVKFIDENSKNSFLKDWKYTNSTLI